MTAEPTLDLIVQLRGIEARAKDARKLIATGVAAGLPVNGTSALRDVELRARDMANLLEKQTGGAEAPPVAGLPQVDRVEGA